MKSFLLKNKIAGVLFIILGVVSIFACDGDATFCVFAVPFGIWLLFMKSPAFYFDNKEDDADVR